MTSNASVIITDTDSVRTLTMNRPEGLNALMPQVSLVYTKKLLLASRRDAIEAARERETAAFRELIGGPANWEAIRAFAEKRPPDFTKLRENANARAISQPNVTSRNQGQCPDVGGLPIVTG